MLQEICYTCELCRAEQLTLSTPVITSDANTPFAFKIQQCLTYLTFSKVVQKVFRTHIWCNLFLPSEFCHLGELYFSFQRSLIGLWAPISVTLMSVSSVKDDCVFSYAYSPSYRTWQSAWNVVVLNKYLQTEEMDEECMREHQSLFPRSPSERVTELGFNP